MNNIKKTRRLALALDIAAMLLGMAILAAGTKFTIPAWLLVTATIVAFVLLIAAVVLLVRVRKAERRQLQEYINEASGTVAHNAQEEQP